VLATIRSAGAYLDADETWELADARGSAARCSLWFRAPRELGDRSTGFIGGYGARDGAAAASIFHHAFERLRASGCERAVGPIDGSTWRRYRLVTWSNGAPPFVLEPANPPEYVAQFEAAGFAPIARYTSHYDPATPHEAQRARAAADELEARGIRVRPFDTTSPERDLRALYAFSRDAFAHNFLQAPIAYEAFAAQYRPVLAFVDPAFFLIAEVEGRICGFLFALPDRAPATAPRLVGKTLARDPAPQFRGLGTLLTALVRHAGASAGYAGFVSALVHEGNASLRIPERHGARVFRRYALYAKDLT
jgi:L-amino acid N-acyltransferase YncA